MRVTANRYLDLDFRLQTVNKNDLSCRGRIVVLDTHGVAASSAATAMLSHDKQGRVEKEIEYDEDGNIMNDDEDDTPVQAQGPVGGRRRGIRATANTNVAEATTEDRLLCGSVLCSAAGGPGASGQAQFMWNVPVFQARLSLMKSMAEQFDSPWAARDSTWIDGLYV
jgi:hypothetical protein